MLNFGKLISQASDRYNPFDRDFQRNIKFAKINAPRTNVGRSFNPQVKRVVNNTVKLATSQPYRSQVAKDIANFDGNIINSQNTKGYFAPVAGKVRTRDVLREVPNVIGNFVSDNILGTKQERQDYLKNREVLKSQGIKPQLLADNTQLAKMSPEAQAAQRALNKSTADNMLYAVMDVSSGLGKATQKAGQKAISQAADTAKSKLKSVGKVDVPNQGLINKAKNYKTSEIFEKRNAPIQADIRPDFKTIRLDMFPNEAVKGQGITKQYVLNALKDANDQGISDITPSLGIWTKDGVGFMDKLAKEGWVVKDPAKWKNEYKISPKIAEWNKTNPLTDIWNQAKLSQPTIGATSRISPKVSIQNTGKALSQGQAPKIARSISKTSSASTSLPEIIPQFDSKSYIKEMSNAQKQASRGGGFLDKLQGLKQEVKSKFVDRFSVIEDTLTKAEKQGKLKVLPTSDIRPQLDRVLRADSIASQFAKDHGLAKVIQDVPDVKAFDQYLIAKQAKDVAKNGLETGRNLAKDDALIRELAPQYEGFAKAVNKYNQDVLNELVDSGMISKNLRDELIKKYPNYVPMNRVFSEIEQQTMGMGGKSASVASVGIQKVVKKLAGSKREIVSPIESILTKTSDAIGQSERNKAARMLASYKDLPGNPFGIKPVSESTVAKNTISAFIDGKKQMFEIDPEFARAAKDMGKQQIGFLGQLFAVPTRLLKLGATGVNIPFVASNVVKDQVFATINSNKALKTSLANPGNFVKSMYSALKQDKLYDDWVRSGASFTSYDLQRNAVKPTVSRIRGEKNIGTKVLYEVTHPQDLLRVVEDIIGKSEELTRIQQFNGARDAYIKAGRTLEDATILAQQESVRNSANFARGGEWTTPLNAAIPYMNAGIQGARSLTRSLITKPVQTSAKIAALVFTPIAYATVWNMSDPTRKAAYDDIPDYEKENNIIILPPNPVQDEDGRWNAIKIPLTPGLSNLGSIVRRQLEGINSIGRSATDVLAALTSFDVSSQSKIMSQVTPQLIKAPLESYTNTNFFTGQKIVPEYMKDLPPEMQVKDNTSGTARKIGKLLNASPLKVENSIRTSFGGVGSQLLNTSDKALAKAGIIPQEQIGGKGVDEQIANRFTSAAGGVKRSQIYDTINKQKVDRQMENTRLKEAIANGDIPQIGGEMTKQRLNSLISAVEEQKAKEQLTDIQRSIFGTTKDQKLAILESNPELANDVATVMKVEQSLKSSSTKLGKIKMKKTTSKGRKLKAIKLSKAPRVKIGSSKLKSVKLKNKKLTVAKLKVTKG